VQIAVDNPAPKGEMRVFNQFTEQFRWVDQGLGYVYVGRGPAGLLILHRSVPSSFIAFLHSCVFFYFSSALLPPRSVNDLARIVTAEGAKLGLEVKVGCGGPERSGKDGIAGLAWLRWRLHEGKGWAGGSGLGAGSQRSQLPAA
jgi:hypothetical protein